MSHHTRSTVSRSSTPTPKGLSTFDELPDCARAALPVVCKLYDISPATAWRRVKQGLIPAPIKVGGSTRWVVGDLRRALAK